MKPIVFIEISYKHFSYLLHCTFFVFFELIGLIYAYINRGGEMGVERIEWGEGSGEKGVGRLEWGEGSGPLGVGRWE